MMNGNIGTFIFSLLVLHCFSQKPKLNPTQTLFPVAADCNSAIKLSSEKKSTYGPTVAPKGFGKTLDIKACDKQDIFTFEKERNSAWYYFTPPDNGDLILEITSINPKNDYDFMLYKWTDSCFCDNLKQGYLLPVRTNLSHTDNKQGVPITGLSADAENEFIPEGLGEEFSKSLPVKKDEKYYLAIDNVYPKGDGHTIKLYYLKEIIIAGVVSDENNKSVEATVWLEDANEKIISAVKCDRKGKYTLNAKIKENEYYTLLYTSDSTFTECRQVLLNEFAKTNYKQLGLKTTLSKLAKGKKYKLSGISFSKGTTQLVPSSYPALNTLARLLLKSKDLKIQIEGHINNPLVAANTGKDNILGENMAREVYNYLIMKGVANRRMIPVSYGSLYMLYEKPKSIYEIEANNRIEIFFLPEPKATP
jgi:outer membrane protein OmpA-like peptidoglycan-associated protein